MATITQAIRIEEYNYSLPEEQIAKFPLQRRDSSKLLICKNGLIQEDTFIHLSEYLPENPLLVFNNTRVIQARMIFRKETGAQIEIFCLEPENPSDYVQAFIQTRTCVWKCMVGNARKWKNEALQMNTSQFTLSAERLEVSGDTYLIRFSWNNSELSFAEVLEICGELPIPPYLNRKTEEADKKTYQTVYSKIKGSVAAPTAGLHFTESVFEGLKKRNVITEELTLHVGAGTFKPVKSKTIADHEMHSEFFSVKKTTIEALLIKNVPVIAVGTTSVRSLESLYYLGVKLSHNPEMKTDEMIVEQWMPYDEENNLISMPEALHLVLSYMEKNRLSSINCHTRILIAPGYTFKIVKGIVTNFHQPGSTLLLLISAFLKGNWKPVYDYALSNHFRFLSYGDSSLLL